MHKITFEKAGYICVDFKSLNYPFVSGDTVIPKYVTLIQFYSTCTSIDVQQSNTE